MLVEEVLFLAPLVCVGVCVCPHNNTGAVNQILCERQDYARLEVI